MCPNDVREKIMFPKQRIFDVFSWNPLSRLCYIVRSGPLAPMSSCKNVRISLLPQRLILPAQAKAQNRLRQKARNLVQLDHVPSALPKETRASNMPIIAPAKARNSLLGKNGLMQRFQYSFRIQCNQKCIGWCKLRSCCAYCKYQAMVGGFLGVFWIRTMKREVSTYSKVWCRIESGHHTVLCVACS